MTHVLSRDCERAAGPTAGLFMLAQVQGLVSAAQHNGRSATVLSYDPARGRYRLTLDGADAGALSHTASSTHRPDRLGSAPLGMRQRGRLHHPSRLARNRSILP